MTTRTSKKTPNRIKKKATDQKAAATGAPASPKPAKPTKLQLLVDTLSGPGGATIAELATVTSWQPHSVRGALAGALRNKGHDIRSEKIDGVRRYSIEGPEA